MLIIAQVLKEKWFENDGFCSFTNNKQTCKWSCQRFRPLSEPISLQDLKDFAHLQAWKKIIGHILAWDHKTIKKYSKIDPSLRRWRIIYENNHSRKKRFQLPLILTANQILWHCSNSQSVLPQWAQTRGSPRPIGNKRPVPLIVLHYCAIYTYFFTKNQRPVRNLASV